MLEKKEKLKQIEQDSKIAKVIITNNSITTIFAIATNRDSHRVFTAAVDHWRTCFLAEQLFNLLRRGDLDQQL